MIEPRSRLPEPLADALARSRLPGLEGVRMIAVLLVILYHFGAWLVPGGFGVMMFFTLSGFLITWLLLKELHKTGGVSFAGFYRRRVLRIFPAFYVFWLLWTSALLLFDKKVEWGQAVSSLAYLTNYYNAIVGDPNTGYSHTWSLGIEEQFYLLWPLTFLAVGLKPKRMIAVLVAIIGFVWVYRTVLALDAQWEHYIYYAFETRADHLAVGCLLAVLLFHGYLPAFWRWCCSLQASLLTCLAIVVSVSMANHFGTIYRNTIGFAIDPLLIALFITQALSLSDSTAWGWLNWRWVRYLGVISYSMYLYQQVLIDPVSNALGGFPVAVQFAGALGAVVLFASASYWLVEKPFLRLKDKPLRSTEPEAPLAAGYPILSARDAWREATTY